MKLFHILSSNPDCYVPYDFVAEHEEQAERNHCGQSVARLNERGGLYWAELYYVIKDRDFDFKEAGNINNITFKHYVLCAVFDNGVLVIGIEDKSVHAQFVGGEPYRIHEALDIYEDGNNEKKK